jgi:hypothetical protein
MLKLFPASSTIGQKLWAMAYWEMNVSVFLDESRPATLAVPGTASLLVVFILGGRNASGPVVATSAGFHGCSWLPVCWASFDVTSRSLSNFVLQGWQ